MAKLQRQQSRPESASLLRSAKPPVRTENLPARPENPLLAEQQAFGNQALQRLLESRAIQAKLTVSAPTDAYEQEAERVADQVLSLPSAERASSGTPEIHRLPERVHRAAKEEKKKEPAAGKPESKKEAPKPEAKGEKKKEEDKVKRAAAVEDKKEEDEEKMQRAAASSAVPEVSPELEHRLDAGRGHGQPLPDPVRSYFEPRFGRDLSQVRIHTGPQAAAAAKDLQAQAFTRGQDMYFASGRYQPQSDSGRRLLAHELTHTVQQGGAPPVPAQQPVAPVSGGVQRSAALIQRAGEGSTPAPAAAGPGAAPLPPMTPATGVLKPETETVTFDTVEIPGFKAVKHRKTLYDSKLPLKRTKGYKRGATAQRNLWKQELGKETANVVPKLAAKYKQATTQQADPSKSYIFKAPPGGPPRHYLGDLATVAKELTTPSWDKNGSPNDYDVDHIVELQLAGWPTDTFGNTAANMELLDSSKNRSSGSVIEKNIEEKAKAFNQSTDNQFASSTADLKAKYNMEFTGYSGAGGDIAETDYWTQGQIKAGDQVVDQLQVVNATDLGSAEEVVIFPGASGVPKKFKWPGGITGTEADWIKPYEITAKNFKTEPGSEGSADFGSLTFTLPPNPDWTWEGGEKPMPVQRVPGARYAGTIDKSGLRRDLNAIRHKKFSPLEITDYDISPTQGIVFSGVLSLDTPVLEGLTIDIAFAGGELTLSKEFAGPDFKLPRPFQVQGSTLKVAYSTRRGLKFEGQVDFMVERVGRGYVKGMAGTAEGLGFEAYFSFNSTYFEPAEIKGGYENGVWNLGGTIGIPDGKVTGLKRATLTASYTSAGNQLSASGEAELKSRFVQKLTLSGSYSDAEGMKFGGTAQLASGLPGIRSGSLGVEVQQPPGGGWKVKANGTAEFGVAGLSATLTGTYDDGIFTLQTTTGFQRGLMAGTVTVGVTNRAVDESGQPTGEAGDEVKVFGGGTVTVKLAPWLQGTAGITFKPEGGVILRGTIGLPSSLELFPQKKVEKNIFTIGLDIPIVGVAVAGQRIGIFATIRGGLEASASFGPGQLRNLGVSLTYDPDDELATTLSGTAQFYVPAEAGLRLFVRGGLGAGIPIVSATANLEVGGQLGVKGAAEANVNVNWTPSTGIDLQADARIYAEPVLTFDVRGSVLVEADLLVKTITLYKKEWQLASFEWGSGMRFGITFPIHYREGQPFDVKLDDVQFQVPDIDPDAVLKGLIQRIT